MNRELRGAYSTVESEPVFRESEPSELDLRDLLAVFWRRRWLFFGTVALIVITSALTVFQLTPRFEAQATVMVAPRTQQIVDIEAVVSGLSDDTQAVESEIQVLRSRGLMKRVLADAGLDRVAEVNPAHPDNRGGLIDAVLNAPLLSAARGELRFEDLDAETRRQLEEAAIVEAMLERLTVSAVRPSRREGSCCRPCCSPRPAFTRWSRPCPCCRTPSRIRSGLSTRRSGNRAIWHRSACRLGTP